MTKEEEYEYHKEYFKIAIEIFRSIALYRGSAGYDFSDSEIDVLLEALDHYINEYRLMLSATAPTLEESKLYE